jgi:hypothetical protein
VRDTPYALPHTVPSFTGEGARRSGEAGLCRFGEAWAALWAENLLTYLRSGEASAEGGPPQYGTFYSTGMRSENASIRLYYI